MSTNNRIGELCWYCKSDPSSVVEQNWRRGYLRAWGEDYREFESGPARFPVGVIEDKASGRCHSIRVDRICFAAESPARKSANQAAEQV